jgi:hypothetical protein
MVFVESLFDNQRNIDEVGVSKRFFAVYIMQETLHKFCMMIKMKQNFEKTKKNKKTRFFLIWKISGF